MTFFAAALASVPPGTVRGHRRRYRRLMKMLSMS